MQEIINHLISLFPTTKDAAAAVEYSERQWLNIRRKVEKGEPLSTRTELWLYNKYQALRNVKLPRERTR